MRLAALAVFTLSLGISQAQTLSVDPAQLTLKMPVGGPLPPVTTLSITASVDWTVTADADYVYVSANKGTGNATVTVTPVDWRPVGEFKTNVTVVSQGITRTVPLQLSVVARNEPTFLYAQPPVGCTTVTPGLPPDNLAVCSTPNLTPPNVGGSYQDPTFGSRVRVIANGYHGYSTPTPISANNKYALVAVNENTPTVVELLTGKPVRTENLGFEGVMWDGKNDNYMYAISGNTVKRFDVSNGNTTTVADYSKGNVRFAAISNGGTGEITRDNWLSFFAPAERQMCTLDLNTSTTYCGAIPAGVNIDFPTMSKGTDKTSGRRYVIGVVGTGPFLIYAVNTAAQSLDLIGRGPENVAYDGGNRNGICDAGEACFNGSHSDTTEDSAGNQFLIFGMEAQHPCEFSMISLQLSKGDQMGLPVEFGGGLKHVMTLFRCGGDKWTDFHMGCAKVAPSCALSVTSQQFGQTQDPSGNLTLPASPYLGEIFTILNNGAEVRRLIMHRSIQFTNEEANGYWSTPRAAISPDGAYVIATSNFGQPNKRRVLVIDSGSKNPRLAAGNPIQNAADYSTGVAPGTLAILYGTDMVGDCPQPTATYPLPKTLCNGSVGVQVEGQDAFMFYAFPTQLAFFVPRAISTPKANATIRLNTISVYGDPVSITGTFPIATSTPALFANAVPDPADATKFNYWVRTFDPSGKERSIHVGEYALAFGVGLGPTSPFVEDGQPSPSDPLPKLASPPQLFVNNMPQKLDYAGLIPGMSGVYQFNWVMNPATPILPAGQQNQIWLQDGSTESQHLLIDLLPAVVQ